MISLKTQTATQDKIYSSNLVLNKGLISLTSFKTTYQIISCQVSAKNQDYGELTNAIKDALELPFYYFTNDKPKATLYILVPKKPEPDEVIQQLTDELKLRVPRTAEKRLKLTTIAPEWLMDNGRFHVLIKLMLALFFYKEF